MIPVLTIIVPLSLNNHLLRPSIPVSGVSWGFAAPNMVYRFRNFQVKLFPPERKEFPTSKSLSWKDLQTRGGWSWVGWVKPTGSWLGRQT